MKTERPRVLFALTAHTRGKFLPELRPDAQPDVELCERDVTGWSETQWAACLRETRPDILVTGWGTPPLPAEWVSEPTLPLKYLCHLAGSVRSLVPRALIERGVLVSNWGNAISHTIAEHAVLLTLGALRQTARWGTFVDHDWSAVPDGKSWLRPRSLRGRRVGIHGFGVIVRELIPLLKAFGADIAVYSQGVPRPVIEERGVVCRDSLEALFAGAEILIECEALSPANRGSVDAGVLGLLEAEAVFVNVGRAQVVDEDALARLAKEKRWSLGLDVFSSEPLPADHPLKRVPHALLSPHIAGPTEDALPCCGEFGLANVRRYLAGEPVEGRMTLEVYDRST